MGRRAAELGAQLIRKAIVDRGHANIVVATGKSQLEMIDALATLPDIAWNQVTGFHLDEYVGMSISHPASFRLYLWQRFISRLPLPLHEFYFLNGEQDCAGECERVGSILLGHPVDVAFVGIGENGHLAFNDPPADFENDDPFVLVDLDEACRRQQLGEGWFPDIESVPRKAITITVKQIMKSRSIICTVGDERKATAVRNAVQGNVDPMVPASILQQHDDVSLILDVAAASLLDKT